MEATKPGTTSVEKPQEASPGVPSNEVYSRVGEEVKLAAHQKVRKGLTAQDIIREISAEYGVRLNVGELRLLLAARREQK